MKYKKQFLSETKYSRILLSTGIGINLYALFGSAFNLSYYVNSNSSFMFYLLCEYVIWTLTCWWLFVLVEADPRVGLTKYFSYCDFRYFPIVNTVFAIYLIAVYFKMGIRYPILAFNLMSGYIGKRATTLEYNQTIFHIKNHAQNVLKHIHDVKPYYGKTTLPRDIVTDGMILVEYNGYQLYATRHLSLPGIVTINVQSRNTLVDENLNTTLKDFSISFNGTYSEALLYREYILYVSEIIEKARKK